MVSRTAAEEAVRNVVEGPERGELLFFIGERTDDELSEWRILDTDGDSAIFAFVRRKAQGAAAGVATTSAGDAGAVAGLGMGSAAGAGEADVPATIRARARHSDKYAAHLVVEPPNSSPYKEAATVIGRHHVATFAHGGHEEWMLGQHLQIAVHCPDAPRRMFVDGKVVYKNPTKDVAILEVQHELPPPELDFGVVAGDKYYVHGQSTHAQPDGTSISHGVVAVTVPDACDHIRGDIVPGAGDSGGGCFSVHTGKLVAMVVGVDPRALKAVLVPAAILRGILTDLSATSGAAGAAT